MHIFGFFKRTEKKRINMDGISHKSKLCKLLYESYIHYYM